MCNVPCAKTFWRFQLSNRYDSPVVLTKVTNRKKRKSCPIRVVKYDIADPSSFHRRERAPFRETLKTRRRCRWRVTNADSPRRTRATEYTPRNRGKYHNVPYTVRICIRWRDVRNRIKTVWRSYDGSQVRGRGTAYKISITRVNDPFTYSRDLRNSSFFFL